jgi:hypothetical protein
MSGSEDAVPGTPDATQHSDGSLDDAALEHVSGGRLTQADGGHPLSWSDLLTDPNVAVPFDPIPADTGTAEASIRAPHDANDKSGEDPKPATNVAYANW